MADNLHIKKTDAESSELKKGQACIVITRTFGEEKRDLKIVCGQKAVETMLKMPHIRDFPHRVVYGPPNDAADSTGETGE